MATERGFYIVGEGNDGTGKSTQIELLAKHVASDLGLETYVMHEPAGCAISSALRTIIKNNDLPRDAITNLLLFTAARHETWNREALPVPENGGVVLSARNYLSTVVYQGMAEALGPDYAREVTSMFMDERYMNPDFVAVFALDDAVRRKRVVDRGPLEHPDPFESQNELFQTSLNIGYASIAREGGYPVIDALGSEDTVQTKFRSLALRAMADKGFLPQQD